jgi:hypothetical protein
MNLEFLKDMSLESTEVRTRSAAVETIPMDGADLRLFSDGRIYPSAQLVEDHNLEYVAKGTDEEKDDVGNGFDIIDTKLFSGYDQSNPRLVMVALVKKNLPKVDLFGRTSYDSKTFEPKSSVIDQGAATTGVWLIELLEEVYGPIFTDDATFVDLKINVEFGVKTGNNIYHLPKKVARGEKKGEITYQRRTDTALWPLTVFEITREEVLEEVAEEEIPDTILEDLSLDDSKDLKIEEILVEDGEVQEVDEILSNL